ncbi:MAG: tetratricopeptide repeat protein [Lachnospiraceae bacterium]|nr:tetratricopeptide repeat protein [Lachnospiraceae bacterium]
MANYDYKVKIEELKNLVDDRDFEEAARLADTISWEDVKKVSVLCSVSDIYRKVKRYEDAIELLELANDLHPGSKEINYSLCELYVKTDNIVAAMECYNTFLRLAPRDERRYLLQYRIYVMQDVRLEERIEILEEYKSRVFRAKWVYELANLYHRLGLDTKCVEICDELFVTDGDGKYVYQALELKRSIHAPLTEAQQRVYDRRFAPESEEEPLAADDEPARQGMEEAGAAEPTPVPEYGMDSKTKEIPRTSGKITPQVTAEEQAAAEELGDTKIFTTVDTAEIQTPHVNVGEYNTMDLQHAIAQNVQEVLGKEAEGDVTRSILAPMLETDSMQIPEIEDPSEEELRTQLGRGDEAPLVEEELPDYEAMLEQRDERMQERTGGSADSPEARPQVEKEVLFGATGEIMDLPDEISAASRERTVYPEGKGPGIRDVASTMQEPLSPEELAAAQARSEALAAQPPEEIAGVLTQEADGQIGLVMPENPVLVKQITGQMNLDDLMLEWERMKQESKERTRQEFHEQVKQQTGKMFTEFEQAVLHDVYEQIGQETREDMELRAARKEAQRAEREVLRSEREKTTVVLPQRAEPEDPYYEDVPEDAYGEAERYEDDQIEELTEIREPEEDEERTEEYGDGEFAEEDAFAEEELTEEEFPEEEFGEEMPEEPGEEEPFEDMPEEDLPGEEPAEDFGDSFEAAEDAAYDAGTAAAESYGAETADDLAAGEADERDAETFDALDDGSTEPDEELTLEERIQANAMQEMERRPEPEEGVRALTREEKERFGAFIQTRLARRQLVEVLDNLSMASFTGNVIVTGDEGTDMVGLATGILQDAKENDGNFTGKVAKIAGKNLQPDKVEETVEHLADGGLIITEASGLSAQTVQELVACLQRENQGLILVMTDLHRPMNGLLHDYPQLAECFSSRIEVKAMSDKKLVAFGKQYARELGCSIDEMGILALSTKITSLQTNEHAVDVLEVKEIIDKAKAHATRKTPGNLLGGLTKKRYDEDGLIVLREKDFQ